MAASTYFELFVIAFILFLPFLYETSHAFRYYLKLCVYYGGLMLLAILLIPVMLFKPFNVENLIMASYFCRYISPIIGLKWELRGREHLEKEQACIIVSNHQSSLDILGMFDIWPTMGKCTVVAKRELMYAGPFGLASWLCGLIFIDRMNSDKAKLTLKEASDFVRTNKTKLWVFPEGTRRNTGEIHPFKKGAFHIAVEAQLPILPVVYSSYNTFLDASSKTLQSGDIIITTLPLISTKGLSTNDIPDLIERTRATMLATFQSSSLELRERVKAAATSNATAASTTSVATSNNEPPSISQPIGEKLNSASCLSRNH